MSKEITPVISCLDDNNPRSLISILPAKMRRHLLNIPAHFLDMDEFTMEKQITAHRNPYVNRVRIAFWDEYEKAQSELRKMDLYNVAHAVGSLEQHVYKLFTDVEIAAWILCPPSSYTIFLDEALAHGLKRLREDILTLPVRDECGEVNQNNLNLIMKAVAFLDMRKHGAIVQKSMNLNLSTTKAEFKELSEAMNAEAIDAKIKELELELEKKNNQAMPEKLSGRDNKSEVEEAETT